MVPSSNAFTKSPKFSVKIKHISKQDTLNNICWHNKQFKNFDEYLQKGSDGPCPAHTSHMSGSDEFLEISALNNSDKKYSCQVHLSPQVDSYPTEQGVMHQDSGMLQGRT